MKKNGKIPKISLAGEGTLLECTETFLGRRTGTAAMGPILDFNTARNSVSHKSEKFLVIEEGDYVLFLGCRHYQSTRGLGLSMMRPNDRRKRSPRQRRVIHEELFSPEWYTSLHFLHKEQIVKVDWHGKFGLDQLHVAASFLYSTFSRPLKMR